MQQQILLHCKKFARNYSGNRNMLNTKYTPMQILNNTIEDIKNSLPLCQQIYHGHRWKEKKYIISKFKIPFKYIR